VLWAAVVRWAKAGAPVFVVDLRRPDSVDDARRLVATHVAGEPDILRRDFFNSLCAAFTTDEISAQLRHAGLALDVVDVGDRHVITSGRR
jgi:NAD(P)-dependent dehydrogenase (short-subunit alcohol dehydrogenase family)